MPAAKTLEIITFTVVCWLGIYLLGRDARNSLTGNAGAGAAFYSAALGLFFLSSEPESPQMILKWGWGLLFLPAYFWSFTLAHLVQSDRSGMPVHNKPFSRIIMIVTVALSVSLVGVPALWDPGNQRPSDLGLSLLALWLLFPLATGIATLYKIPKSDSMTGSGVRAALIVTLFFTPGTGLILYPLKIIDPGWLLIGIAGDFILLGLLAARLDAFNLGENLIPEFSRTFCFSMALAALFGGQVALIIWLSTGPTFPMLVLLHFSIAAALVVGVFSDSMQAQVENWLSRKKNADPEALDYRAVAKATLKIRPENDLLRLDPEAFYRHTRRALSEYANLPKLVKNPLIYLNAATIRLEEHSTRNTPLERARILKEILQEAVHRLKPGREGLFDETDEWRYFNALYYPYIIGLRPYSRKLTHHDLNEEVRQALHWFRHSVPERTLYNWQQTAARLIDQDLRDL